jgi:hypothetical protein
MKAKIIFISALLLGSYNFSFGQVTLVAGSLDFLKEQGRKTIKIEFSYNDLKVNDLTEDQYINKIVTAKNDKEPGLGDKWKAGWFINRTDKFETQFESSFNYCFSDTVIVAKRNIEDAKYIMEMKTTHIFLGFYGGVVADQGSIDCSLSFREVNKPDEILAVLNIEHASMRPYGGVSTNESLRIADNYGKAGDMLAHFIIKQCKLKR